MSTTEMASQTSSDDTSIRPFQVGFPDADVEDLRRRVEATRWPERETVGDDSQGVRLELIQELARYWAPEHDSSWAERAYPDNLIHDNGLDKGGHFAAWEQPELFTGEMRAAFRWLR